MFTNRLEGKRAFITGATAGIGEASARQLADLGVNLVLNGRREERLKQLKDQLLAQNDIEIQIAPFDVRDREACRNFIQNEMEQPVDILVNNAGLASGIGKIYDGDFEDWDKMLDTNVKGLLNVTRFVSPYMKERNSGHIINVGSIAGHQTYPGGAVYTASKYAVRAITESAKKDFHGTRVRVSEVSPGFVETEFSKVRFDWDEERAEKVYKGFTPLSGDDVAELIVFIANRPGHVTILDSIIFPTAQSDVGTVDRSGKI